MIITDISPKAGGQLSFKYRYDLPILVNQSLNETDVKTKITPSTDEVLIEIENNSSHNEKIMDIFLTNSSGEEIKQNLICKDVLFGHKLILKLKNKDFKKIKIIYNNAKEVSQDI